MMTNQNIRLNNVRSLDARLLNDEYFDYMLYKGGVYGVYDPSNQLIADFSCPFDIENDKLYSTAKWSDAVNNGVEMEDIGFTGMDNGFIKFRKDRISNKEFLDLLTASTYSIEEDDDRLFLSPVTGNTLTFEYPMEIVNDDKNCYIAFKGGFYQGFYKLYGFDYQVLPNGVDVEWNLNFKIRPRSDYEVGKKTVNFIHPENKGIFFFMGTRAENKFWNFYKTDSAVTETFKKESSLNDGYFDSGETYEKQYSANDYLDYNDSGYSETIEETTDDYNDDGYFANDEEYTKPCSGSCEEKKCECSGKSGEIKYTISDFFAYKYQETSNCGCGDCKKEDKPCGCKEKEKQDCSHYYQDGYFEKDITINASALTDSFGHEFLKKGYYEIESDNKFLMFDRTPEGFNVHNWVEGTTVTLTGRQNWANINYFPIMNRTCTGYTVKNIDEYQEENSTYYNVYKDIKNNVFALKITENGAIGYKYGILDCDADNEQHYTVIEEYTKDGMVKYDEWNDITVKFTILNPSKAKCDPYKGKRKMKISIYVNGFLKLISKELNEFNFRELDDVYQKQEGVPFNISLGGGTQGLLESIMPDYYSSSESILPIEKDFCGTFLGDIESFRFYDGALSYFVAKNYLWNNKEII